ncbi:metallophosphoesterase [Jatrophihabitans endophyticus]|uniref:metallophosphoesterase n=1 Tax=Jatrophihabitans endophyticus TaxID=1206085 RepID=UPI0019DCCAE5|nr:metallophosphoesterase [Jatrophihabitans endophyticus]MBE7189307.1 metallophosphoesterase [Jatrophihabitans endophyticus]
MPTRPPRSPQRRVTARRAGAAVAGAGTAAVFYGSVIERNAFVLRRRDVPVLSPGSAPLRVLHLSDLHITAGQRRKQQWIRSLAALEPDLVVNTGDTLSAVNAMPAVLYALEPLAEFPAVFVPGNNDYYAPRPKNPLRYFQAPGDLPTGLTRLPWGEMAASLVDAGWTDLTHVRTVLAAGADGAAKVALAGTDDPHLRKARYELIAGAAEPGAAVRIGVTHSPEPTVLGAFAGDGYDLVLAGHTHGGQVRLPGIGAVVTNCGIDRARARWLHRWDEHMYFHVSAGLGTNPFSPIRFCCRPEATLLTLTPREG